MGPSKGENVANRINTRHQRLCHALCLGIWVCDDNGKKWRCTDIEIQRHVVRSIEAFLDCFSRDTSSSNRLLKDSVSDITGALVFILGCRNRVVVSMAANVIVKLVGVVPSSIVQLYALDFVESLSPLFYCHQADVALHCAVALKTILLSLRETKEKEVWKILEERKAVASIVGYLRDFSGATLPVEFFQEMAALLATILLRWPHSRYRVWNEYALMEVLEGISQRPDMGLRVAALKLYSAVALCGHGNEKLLENGKPLLGMMISCMEKSSPHYARIEGLKLAQRLVAGRRGCLKVVSMGSEALVKTIIQGMSEWSLCSGKLADDQMCLLVESCKLALITRWEGEHHILFWKYEIAKVLLSLVMENFRSQPLKGSLSMEEQISIAEKGLSANFMPSLRSYVWDIIGYLAIHFDEDFNPSALRDGLHLNILVTCACLTFSGLVQKGYQICQNNIIGASESESASRAALMMIHSPCKYVSSMARAMLSEILKTGGKQYVQSLIRFLRYTASGKSYVLPNILQTVVCLVGLTCFSGIPHYTGLVIEHQGIEILLSFCRWYLKNRDNIGASSSAAHLQSIAEKRICCWAGIEDWDNKDTLLLYALSALAELICHSCSEQNQLEEFSTKRKHVKDQLCSTLQEIRDGSYGPGPRWYAAHVLSYFGYYGFQSNFGKRFMRALKDEECGDMQLIFASGSNASVHRVILAVRCPSLLPPEEESLGCSAIKPEKPPRTVQEIRMSALLDRQVLTKLLEFVYSGYVEADNAFAKKLKTLARHCNSQILLKMLNRKAPKWGSSIPRVDLRLALNPALPYFSDIILKCKETDLDGWSCCMCSSTSPHVHTHRVLLSSSCEYLRALFQSGMQESHSDSLTVPVSWLALTKLLNWFYANELPKPPSGCIWNNMNTEEKLYELRPYVEIYSQAEFWILEDLQDECGRIIESCLESCNELSIKTIQLATDCSLWNLAEVAAKYAAPIYHKLRNSGDLDELEEEVVNMIRNASVRFTREGNRYS